MQLGIICSRKASGAAIQSAIRNPQSAIRNQGGP